MRGTHQGQIPYITAQGLIPTYAGNTAGRISCRVCGGAHPHVCGEHERGLHGVSEPEGSSPRMRGTHSSMLPLTLMLGLIPTYAGNTCYSFGGGGDRWAHPHVCGEHICSNRRQSRAVGSSPRMRGTLRVSAALPCSTGLIPTYAGNTERVCVDPVHQWAHPHVCGEHSIALRICVHTGGSSPRMRGTHTPLSNPPAATGLIPTYAGNTHLEEHCG